MNSYSKIISGTMTWGVWGKQFSAQHMQTLLHHCIENNITSFDHADIYGAYTTEAQFGTAFYNSGIGREKIQLISKCGIQLQSENRNNRVKHYNYSKKHIVWSVENSLKHLKTDYLDLLLLHRPSPLMQPDDIAEAITTLKKEGKLKHFGVSNFTASQMELIQSRIALNVNQIEFSLTQNSALHNGTLDYMTTNGIKPLAWSPLGTVFKQKTEQTRRIYSQLATLLNKYNATEAQLLLAWVMEHPAGITPVVGTTNHIRLQKAMDATHIKLDLEDWFLMLAASQGHEVA